MHQKYFTRYFADATKEELDLLKSLAYLMTPQTDFDIKAMAKRLGMKSPQIKQFYGNWTSNGVFQKAMSPIHWGCFVLHPLMHFILLI